MIILPGYAIQEKIYESDSSIIYRGQRIVDNKIVILKLLKEEYPSLEKVSRFMHENEILKLLNEDATVAVYDLVRHKNTFVIILEDGGQDLQQYLASKQRLQLPEAIELSIQIIEALDKIHKHHVIHKDINPSNILRSSSSSGEKIKIIDFGISSTLPKEILEVFSLNQLEGTLPYLSPEQTGRMNRGIDYRSDYYSLGATLYQIFTGALPFASKDTLELVYSHIAKMPISPAQLDSAIPKTISDIIMKLLEKTAEKRYQSGYGIITDLQHCLLQLQKTGTVNEFELGKQDFSGRFQVPDKLYGRESEIAFVLDTFSRVSQGHSEFMLVAGYSGVGKSSLVHEVHKPIVEKRGYFISGKFDQLKRNIPYAPFVQAFEGLIQQLLTENESAVNQWKETIIAALGPNGGVMTEVLPSLVKIIGVQPPMLELGPTETQNRFISVFQNFVQALATQEHPLVMFLDDLQWVDLASLKLLDALLLQPNIKYLLIIGAYRDNEVNEAHPLTLALENLRREDVIIETLTLSPLKVTDIQQLLADTLLQENEVVQTLATICHAKTLGNPFFLNQFLRALCDENLITFDTSHGIWHWLIDKIKARTGTDNVVDLVVSNIQKLLPETRLILTLAACLGNRFDLQVLSALYEKSPKLTAQALDEALKENFILPLDESYRFITDDKESNAHYQFFHDRVQQAAYSLLSEENKKVSHLKVGRHLLKILSKEKQEEELFDIANQFNLGAALVTNRDEKIELARLNLRAGKKAKASAAYSVAYDYLKLGLGLLTEDDWKSNYDLILQLYTEAASAAYLSDNFTESDKLSNLALTQITSVLDQTKIYETKIYTEIARNAPAEAVAISLEVLKKLGISFPKKPRTLDVLISLLKTKLLLLGKKRDRLVNLPTITDPYRLAACNILSAGIAPAYFATPLLFPLFTLKLLNLSIRYGYSKGTPAAYASYGIILCGILGDVKHGYWFGQLAEQLVDHFHSVESEAKIALMVNGFVLHWQDPFRDTLAPLLAAHLRGVETGDLEYSTYSAYFYMVCSFYSGVELNKIAVDMKRFYEFSKFHHTHKPVFYSMTVLGQVVENLMGHEANPLHLAGKYYNEDTMVQEAIDTNNLFGLYSLYVVKVILNYLFYNYDEAYQSSLIVPTYVQSATGAAPVKVFNFYDSLNRIALYEKATPTEKRAHLKIVAANQKQLKHWMKFAPENCLHKYYLVEAELARLHRKIDYAEKCYDKAMQLSKQYEFVQEHALASELAAKFYLAEGKEMVAKGYMTEAYYSYTKWGAVAKLRHLESNYSNLLSQTPTSSALAAGTIQGSITNYASESLDLSTVVKASQTIAREIVLADLLKQLMSFLIENAGAQKGYLLLEKEGRWTIEASVDADKVTVLQSLPFENEMPQSVIQYVIHSKESVVLDDATTASQFNSDPYILHVKPKSILSIPLLNQGVLSGVLYLENNLMTGAFTQNRVDLLNLLSTQIVISIENARLYTGMKNLNLAYERFIPKEFLSALEKKNIIDVKLGDQVQKDMTVMFCDIRNFTAIS
ncbi:MAG: AAA family ATPase, partial [Gammaproteobacteria bacterium]